MSTCAEKFSLNEAHSGSGLGLRTSSVFVICRVTKPQYAESQNYKCKDCKYWYHRYEGKKHLSCKPEHGAQTPTCFISQVLGLTAISRKSSKPMLPSSFMSSTCSRWGYLSKCSLLAGVQRNAFSPTRRISFWVFRQKRCRCRVFFSSWKGLCGSVCSIRSIGD